MEGMCILQNFCVPCPQLFCCSHVTGHSCHPKAPPLRIAFPIQSVAIVLEFSRHPRKRGRVEVQQLAFLYNKEEKDAAILKFRKLPQCLVERQVGGSGREGQIKWFNKSVGALTLMHVPHVCMKNP